VYLPTGAYAPFKSWAAPIVSAAHPVDVAWLAGVPAKESVTWRRKS
jgi:hypothetical protein